jgi:hypothetical protein
MKDLRPWTAAALYGALWGSLEATAGTALHLGRVPFRGEIMGLLGLVCLVFTLGGLYPGPLVGIATQALAVELAFLVAPGCWAAALGGAVALGTNPVQRVVTAWILGGTEAATAVLRAVGELGGIDPVVVLSVLVAIAAAVGAVGGALSWRIAGRVQRRLGGGP